MNIQVGMKSVNTGIEKRDNHLRSKEFFNVDEFQFAKFYSDKGKKFKIGSDGKVVVNGKLKIKDIEKSVALVLFVKNSSNGVRIYSPAEFSLTINRLDFNVKHNIKVNETMLGSLIGKFKKYVGQNVIGNTVSIRVNINAVEG